MGWTAHIQRTGKPGTLGGRRPQRRCPLINDVSKPEKTGRKLIFPQMTLPDSEEHADRRPSLSNPRCARTQLSQTQMLPTSLFSHLSNGHHQLHPNSLTAVKKTNLEATGKLQPERLASGTKKGSAFPMAFTFSVLSK